MFKQILEKVSVGIITAVVLGGLTLLWNWGSHGGVVKALGGITIDDAKEMKEQIKDDLLGQGFLIPTDNRHIKFDLQELQASANNTTQAVLGPTSEYIAWSLVGTGVYRHGANLAGELSCEIFTEGGSWVLKAKGGDQDEKGTFDMGHNGTAWAKCKAIGIKWGK